MDTRRFSAAVLTGRISAAVVSSTLAVAPASAGELWDGGSPFNANWSSPNNWQPNGVPANDGTSDLVFAGTARLSPVMDADWDVHMIEFSATAGAFQIGGTSALTIRHQIANYDAQLQTISVGSIQTPAGAAQTWYAVNGPLRLETDTGLLLLDDLTFAGGFDVTLAGGGSRLFGAEISKSGTGALILESGGWDVPITVSQGTLRLGGSANIGSAYQVTVDSAGTLDMNGTNEDLGRLVGDGAVINNNGYLAVGGDGSSFNLGINLSGSGELRKTGAGDVTLSGLFDNACPEISVRQGKLISSGRINNAAVAVEVDTSAWLDLGSSDETLGSLAGNGFVDLNAQRLTLSGNNMATKCTGIITGVGGSLRLNGQNARLNLASANDYSGGTVIRSSVASQPATLLANNASGSASGSGAVEVKSGGVLGGDGSVGGAVTVESQGQIAPGGSESLSIDAGSLALAGAGTFQAGSSLAIEIGGATAGTQFDQLSVGGLATLNGTLSVRLIAGFKPTDGQSFEFLKFGSRSGTFAALDAPPGFSVSYSVLLKNATLRYAACPGDTDGNKTVNQDDIDTVLFNYGRSVPAGMNGDLDFDGDVDQDDIDAVLFYFGTSC